MRVAMIDVYPNPEQPRKLFDPAALAELAESIAATGLLQPITVVERPTATGRWMVVAGERRYRAHVLLGANMIEANVVAADDDAVAINAIVENLQRVDVTPLEEAQAFARMLARGYTPESLAAKLGMKQPHRIADRVQLLRLRPDLLELFRAGHLTPSQAFELSRLEPAGQAALFRMLRDGRCDSYATLRAAADGILAAEAQTALFELPPPPTAEERSVLSRFERLVDRLTAACNEGIRENEVVVLRKVDPDRAATVIQQLGLIRADLARIERALTQSLSQASLRSA